ncbi:MerR family transcriptional regulator [Rhodococcus sp. NPDC058521]|uniref:MerR family transcriptional regulator n=1 Tax=Rhodococcus sp. NPDC058521 TaxID=3346536 RepID=UPI00366930ED
METLDSQTLRTAEVGRLVGCSVQQIRNLERDGVLPTAHRTTTGYRLYRPVHVRCARAYRALALAVGPVEAKQILRAVHEESDTALARLDAAHAGLHRERIGLALTMEAVAAIAAEPIAEMRPGDAMTVAELADALGVRPSTLRHWDAEGLVVPGRVAPRRRRWYSPADVRDARIVHQLRSAGYRVPTLRVVMRDLPLGGSVEIEAALAARHANIEMRSRALLDAAAELAAISPPAIPR